MVAAPKIDLSNYITTAQAAEMLGTSINQVNLYVKRGKKGPFPSSLRGPGGRYLILKSEVTFENLYRPVSDNDDTEDTTDPTPVKPSKKGK